ncbi:ATP-binding protein [Niveibacterium sp. SC-1]|uniref:ATP-binding protein n=1 Tax=Niveibacterium sp. SC-1 TaxID=3135646 RepID=UPI00311DD8B7
MRAGLRRLVADTLSKRLFLLMWATLVVSHILGVASVRWLHGDTQIMEGPPGAVHMPVMPSLPPTPGLNPLPGPDEAGQPPGSEGPGPREFEGMAPPGMREAPHPFGHGFGTRELLLDYGVRLIVMAIAAWFASRWLAAPVRRLVEASRQLGSAIEREGDLPMLDEAHGTHEVREAAQVFNSMARQLRTQFAERGLMIAAISHDLRTPLTRLRMRLESIDGHEALLERSAADIREMDSLIDSVLTVFRRAGMAEPPRDTDIAALLQSMVDDLAEQKQAVSFSGTPAVAKVQANALRRVAGNLINNALRYGGQAVVTVGREGDEVSIVVEDEGPGIPEEQLESVFQPFYRIEGSRNRGTGGTGLGLYIARDLIQRQGGSLRLSNRPAGGLRAELRLPAGR